LNYQRDNMQEAPAPAILPLNSTPEGIIDGNPSSFAATAGTAMAEVIILMSLAKSSHESPAGRGTDDSVAAAVAVGMPEAREGMKAVAEGSVVDSQNAGARPGATSVLRPGPQSRCDIQAMVPGFQGVQA
jgi:hypothetical protein